MSDDKKSYYAIIPASVRYDKRLTANAKLLYGEITALCNEQGYCWASNDYFASLYEVSKQSISHWIKQLCDYGYIKSSLIYAEGTKEIKARYLTLLLEGTIENYATPTVEKFKDNITSSNNTNNNTSKKNEVDDLFDQFYASYPKKVDKTDARKVFHSLIKSGVKTDTIFAKLAIYRQKINRESTELKFIRGPARFLRTLEDYEESSPTSAPKPSPVKKCPKCGSPMTGLSCKHCFTNFDSEGNEV